MINIQKKGFSLTQVGLTLYAIARFLERVNLPINSTVWNILILLSCSIMIIKKVFIKSKVKIHALALLVLLIVFLGIDSIPSGAHELLYLAIIMWSIQGSDIDKLVKLVYKLTAVMTVIVVVLALVNILPNNSTTVGSRIRYNVGFYGYDVLPIQYLSLVFGYSIFQKNRPRFFIVVMLELGGALVYFVTKVRTTFIILTIYIVVWLFFYYKPIKHWKRINFLIFTPTICVAFSFFVGYLFKIKNAFIWMINGLIMFRISMQNYMLDKYGINILGSTVPWSTENENQYMYVDNSYINILLTWGIIGLTIILLIYIFIIYYAISTESFQLLLVSISICILALMWNVLMVFPYVEFILYASKAFDVKFWKRKKVNKIRKSKIH